MRVPPVADSPARVLDLQKSAGNRAVADLVAPVQRVGGWSDADTAVGNGIDPTGPQSGWNVEEHAVGEIRRIPLDGLLGGLQGSQDETNSARKLSREGVNGPVKGSARSDPKEQKGQGRAVALVPKFLAEGMPVEVFFHLHGNTEEESRGFGGWRQHRSTAMVRDVARDRIAQQIEESGSKQTIGILPQGVRASQFGSIDPDRYIRDAFDRLGEVGAWKVPPSNFRVVLSAHSGGSFAVGQMISNKTLPANLKTLALYEALHVRADTKEKKGYSQVAQFAAWLEGMIGDHADFLNATKDDASKRERLDGATQVRLYWDPSDPSYNKNYVALQERIDRWFADNSARLGANATILRDLIVFVPIPGVHHEGMLRAGVKDALTRGGAGGTGPTPTKGAVTAPVKGAVPVNGAPAVVPATLPPVTPLSVRARDITAVMVAAQAPSSPILAAGAFTIAVLIGTDRLTAAARILHALAPRSETDLTDAVFTLAHPELGGGRIPADRADLKADWITLRRDFIRPAMVAPAPPTGADVGPAAPASAPVPAAPGAAPVPIDPATVEAAEAATGAITLDAAGTARALATALTQAKTAGKKADQDAVANTLLYNKTTVDEWFGGLKFDAAFLDVPITASGGRVPGVHSDLAGRLKIAEDDLIARFPGLSRAQIAGRMGINVISGVRPPKKATGGSLPSYHCFGLAIDINHPTNPFVGNKSPTLDANKDKVVTADEQTKYDVYMQNRSPRIIERAMRLLHQEAFDIESAITVPHGAGSAAGRLWDIHHRASEALAEYLRLADDLEGARLSGLVTALRTTGDTRDLAFWRTRIAQDRAVIGNWDFMHHPAPQTGGYLDLGKELVESLVAAGLLWGGSYGGAKDMMHFDWRDADQTLKRPPKGWRPPPAAPAPPGAPA